MTNISKQDLQEALNWCDAEPTEEEIMHYVNNRIQNEITVLPMEARRSVAYAAIKCAKSMDRDILIDLYHKATNDQ